MDVPDLRAYADSIRDSYQPRPMTWVLNRWEYDFIAKAAQEGRLSAGAQRFFSQCVRAEPVAEPED